MLLLGVQERWLTLLLDSKAFNQRVAERDASVEPEFSLFAILRPYLDNFEHVLSLKDSGASDRNFEKLMSIVDGTLKLMVTVREMNAPAKKKKSRRKKAKKSDDADAATTDAEKGGFVLVWDDPATTKLVGDKTDCVWTAEQLWNIANQLMAGDKKGVAADVFAASHDFCLMSEEEVVSKNALVVHYLLLLAVAYLFVSITRFRANL